MRYAIVNGLERACTILDDLPGMWVVDGCPKIVRHAQYGCWPLRLSKLAVDLDERWSTGVWGDNPDGSGPQR